MLIIEIFAIFHLTFAIEIRKSPNDPREYRFVKLKSNGLPTILISDKNAEKAAAALQVAVGSLTEPKEYPGLAHFLEHILFLGTKKYPETGDFTDFIEKHGGGANAFTADDRTVYMFEVTPEHLEPAMDRQAQFFINPLFDKDYVDKERNAVDSEYHTHMKSDPMRLMFVLKQLVNPLHPYSRFDIGNLDTLPGGNKSTALRDAAIQFYSTYYTLNRMSLGVGGHQSLDELEAMAERTYGQIHRRSWDGNGKLDNGASVTLFPYAYLRRRVEVETVSDTQYLNLLL